MVDVGQDHLGMKFSIGQGRVMCLLLTAMQPRCPYACTCARVSLHDGSQRTTGAAAVPALTTELKHLAFAHCGSAVASLHTTTQSSQRWPEGAQVDYILFARADVALQPNPDEVRAVRYVDAAALRDMMDPASGLRWSPWFRRGAGARTAHRGAWGRRHLRCCCLHKCWVGACGSMRCGMHACAHAWGGAGVLGKLHADGLHVASPAREWLQV